MSRARGTYTTLENWALDLAPSLPGAAGWVLLKLAAQLNYKRKTMTVGQLLDCLPYGVRAVQTALAFLAAEGYTEAQGGAHVLCGPRTKLVQSTSQNVRVEESAEPLQEQEGVEAYSAITLHNQKESEGREERENQNTEASASKARDSAAPVVQTESWLDQADREMAGNLPALLGEAPDGAPADAGRAPGDTPERIPAEASGKPSRPTSSRKVPRPPAEPSGFQLMFQAVALACYGSAEHLTSEASARIGKASKSLLTGHYQSADVPQILTWIRRHEAWRTGLPAPQTLADRAPAWKAGSPGNVLLTAGRHAAPDSSPASTAPRRVYG